MEKMIIGFLLFISPAFPVGPSRMELHAEAKELCFGVNNEPYWCETGYCCGETECCTYYYELWWFWLVWTIIIMLSCCCAYRHRRVKLRLQQEQRQREISLMAYQGASTYTTQPLDLRFWTNCKLPDYEEVAGHPPTPPPPYTELQQQNTQTSNHENAVVESQPVLQESAASPVQEGEATMQEVETSSSACEQEDEHQVPDTSVVSCSSDRVNGNIIQDEESADFKTLEMDSHLCDQGEMKEDSSSRQRRITGDSGIEVCVCQMDEDPYHEEVGLMDGDGAQECCEAQSSCNSQVFKRAQNMQPKQHTKEQEEKNSDVV
ncbi:WW domain-binding protein 1-like [Pristis pectinata]|uniref:WW domain-binding protein 1-like n=1 Tax=Pristis pectinata TaxID=685728 RepID=UPI00223D93AB|nr:WW domain-binding protein 1-like [Pristis pectinata]